MTTDKTADQLRSCPFCGGEAVIRSTIDDMVVRCLGCNARVIRRHDTESDEIAIYSAIKAWNTRADSGEVVAWQVRFIDPVEGPSPYWNDCSREQYNYFVNKPDDGTVEFRKLYTHPCATSAEVERDAARYRCDACRSIGSLHCSHPEECGQMREVK